ncbi:hypothetical protein QJS04_geneDACA013073 [Acorus gramineus]|uniref:Methyltransferase small domain-containing protein n=1 Tax=Acorus gramineus TaxID=55184 RepID=A0AAV9B689_ACOGR|nr:hypothetical protein QJS04_geneDACA013073 [Acorus gramineus]
MEHNIELESVSISMPSIRAGESEKRIMSKLPSKITSRGAQIHLVSRHPEVYEPCDDSFALVDALLADRTNLLEHKPMLCLEIGCGCGYIITSLATMLGDETNTIQYFATDINPHAAEATCKTSEAHGVHVEVVLTDITSSLGKRLSRMVDVVVVNPPYVPTPEEEVGCEGITASWAGGENGRSVIDRILPVVDELLSEKGWLYMVTLTANKPSQICRLMGERGYASRIVVQRSTEEESLHVIKFWREVDEAMKGQSRTATQTASDSWFLQFSRSTFWRRNN